jgi:hypothetical protein
MKKVLCEPKRSRQHQHWRILGFNERLQEGGLIQHRPGKGGILCESIRQEEETPLCQPIKLRHRLEMLKHSDQIFDQRAI